MSDIFIKFIGPTIHPRGGNFPQFYPIKADPRGYLVLNLGWIVGFDFFFLKDIFSVRFAQALYKDCAGLPAGFVHTGVRGRMFKSGKHSIYGGLGPTLIFRESWTVFPDYKDDGYFSRWGGLQWKFIIYGGEFEYNYKLKENTEISVTFIPGYPLVLTFAFGVKFFIER